MSLNIRSICTSFLLIIIFAILVSAQTSADVMRERVAKAKAYIAVKNYNAAIYELENIRRETKDPTVNNVINVLLMNSYLEQGDYNRAQEFLKSLSNPQNKQKDSASYYAVAGQVVKCARNQLERYRSLGLSVSDRSLPIEAAVDIQKMRETLELIVDQSKTLGAEKTQAADAMALLEEATNARSSLAKDDYDATRWKNEAADAREMLANSRSVVINAVSTTPVETATVENSTTPVNSKSVSQTAPANTNPTQNSAVLKPVPNPTADQPTSQIDQKNNAKFETESTKTEKQTVSETPKQEIQKPIESSKTKSENDTKLAVRERKVDGQNENSGKIDNETTAGKTEAPKDNSPMAVGSLVEYATQKSTPVYPLSAKSLRMTGVVRVELIINEDGEVAEIQNTSGPSLLQRAAADAVKKWKFKPFVRDGEPVKASGFVSFNFNL